MGQVLVQRLEGPGFESLVTAETWVGAVHAGDVLLHQALRPVHRCFDVWDIAGLDHIGDQRATSAIGERSGANFAVLSVGTSVPGSARWAWRARYACLASALAWWAVSS